MGFVILIIAMVLGLEYILTNNKKKFAKKISNKQED